MTQPIQEPSTGRTTSGLEWGQSQLARRPPPVNPGGDVAWIALADDGCNENVDGSLATAYFDQGYVSDNATGIFDLTTDSETTSGCGSETVYHASILVPGIYTFSLEIEGDFDPGESTPPQAFSFHSLISPFNNPGSTILWPGSRGVGYFELWEHIYIPSGLPPGFQDVYQLWACQSRTIPLLMSDAATPGPIVVGYEYSPGFDQFFAFQFWVTYHGPINYTSTFQQV